MTTPASPPFENPYPGLRRESDIDDSIHRINIDVAKCDTDFIRSVSVDHGSITTILKMFVKFLSNECRRHNWSLADRAELTELVRERCTPDLVTAAIDSERRATSIAHERPHSNDRRGTGGMGDAATSDQDELPSVANPQASGKSKKRKRDEKIG